MELPNSSGYAFMADSQPQRKRARQACISCNARRVKCNVTETAPNSCSNCIAANVPCETRESRRGKHPRPSKKRRAGSDATSAGGDGQHPDEVAAGHSLLSLHRDRLNDVAGQNIIGSERTIDADQQLSPDLDRAHEEDTDVFLGESSSLRYVTDVAVATQAGPLHAAATRLRHSVPNAIKAETLVPQWEVDRRQGRLTYLKKDGAFSLPSSPVTEGLMKAYFQWFHPCFAIVDEVDIWNQYHQGTLSALLLQSILFIGVLHCDEEILQELGFDSRHRAKYLFYNRAKDIYDAEYERRKITVIQALFLMSFWRAGALLEKDTRHWLGCAINLAQTKALHRSAGTAETQDAKLRKRIWWSLYGRDRQCAAALGLPNRVRDEDCDFEPLEISDFEYAFNPSVSKESAEEYASYHVTMTELARLLGSIVQSGYLPNKGFSSLHRLQMKEELMRFKQRLPPMDQAENQFTPQPDFFANMQHLAYNNLLILLYRHDYIASEDETRESSEGNVVLQTAAQNSRIIEDMLSDGSLRHGQIHVITNLFNTLCIHTVHLNRSDGTAKTVAEHRAKLCLLGLQELQKTWEVTNWVLQLFFQYLDRATAARLKVQEDDHLLSTGGIISKQPTPGPQNAVGMPMRNHNHLPNNGNVLDSESLVGTLPDGSQIGAPTPWSWSSEEANQFLFSQIENEFAFGEGEMLNWSPDQGAVLGQPFFPPPDMDPNFIP